MAPFAQKRMLAPLPKLGRPTEYRPEYDELVRVKMGEGLSLTAFAGFIGVSRESVYRWKSAHSTFRDAVARAETARALFLERRLLVSVKGAQTAAMIFALRNAQPDEWKDVRSVQHQHTHEIAQLTDAQLHQIAAGSADISDGVTIEGEAQHLNER